MYGTYRVPSWSALFFYVHVLFRRQAGDLLKYPGEMRLVSKTKVDGSELDISLLKQDFFRPFYF